MLLSEGRTIFIGEARDAVKWFQKNDFICPPSSSSADFFLDVISKV